MCHGDPECAPSWTRNEAFGNVFGSQHIPTCMLWDSELTTESDTCKSMVTRSTPTETVKQVKLYFDTCASHMSTPFKEDFVTLNEEHTDGNLGVIASSITIQGTGTIKYVMIDDTGKPYTMMVEEYWTCSIPRRPVRYHSLVYSENSLFIIGIGLIRDKEL